MSPSKSIVVVLASLCLVTLVYGFDPAKPKPPEVFQASYFTMGGFGYSFTRGYFDGVHRTVRTDFFDQKGQKINSYIGFYNLNKLYIINSTSNDCQAMQTPPWSDPFTFLNAANYVGTKQMPDGKSCEAWENDYGFGSTAVTCWRGNELSMQIINGKNMQTVYAYTTDYETQLDDGVFDLPKSCNANGVFVRKPVVNWKRSGMESNNVLFPQQLF
jgi:hypothetical protein